MIHIKHPTKEQLPVLAKLFDAYRVFYRKVSDLQGANAYPVALGRQTGHLGPTNAAYWWKKTKGKVV